MMFSISTVTFMIMLLIKLRGAVHAHPELLMQLLQMPFQNQMQFPTHQMQPYQYHNTYNSPQAQQQEIPQQQEYLQQQQLQQQQQQYNQPNHQNQQNQQNSIYEQRRHLQFSDQHTPYNELQRLSNVAMHGVTNHRQPVHYPRQQVSNQRAAVSAHNGGDSKASSGGGVEPPTDYPRAYRPTQAHINFSSALTNALNPLNFIQEVEQQQQVSNQQQGKQEGPVESFGFAPGTPVLFCGYGLPIPQYDTPRKKCVPWHPLCGITFTCIMDV